MLWIAVSLSNCISTHEILTYSQTTLMALMIVLKFHFYISGFLTLDDVFFISSVLLY